jgi:AraC-like DNA-binding protein
VRKPASRRLAIPSDAEELESQLGTLFGPLEEDLSEISILGEGALFNGRVEVHCVQPGMRLLVMNMDARQDARVDIHPIGSGVLMSLVLDGRSGYSVQRSARRHDPWELLPGRNIVGTFKTEASCWKVSGGDSHRLVELQIASGRALQLASQYPESKEGAVHCVLSGRNDFATHLQQSLSTELRTIGLQILNCPLEGSLRHLFMESKALEILAFQLGAPFSSRSRNQPRPSKDECDRLQEARKIIEREFVDPPSLLTLARRVGLNDFKLKRGFRELYQTTVFGYVRMLRMERARMMLESAEMNVSEVALATGYSCFGHFAEAFRKHFGLTPRDYRNRRSF